MVECNHVDAHRLDKPLNRKLQEKMADTKRRILIEVYYIVPST